MNTKGVHVVGMSHSNYNHHALHDDGSSSRTATNHVFTSKYMQSNSVHEYNGMLPTMSQLTH